MVVDAISSLVGSANWAPCSLQLNFEFNVEAYDADLAASLTAIAESKHINANPVTSTVFGTIRCFTGPDMAARDFLARLPEQRPTGP
jgi:phosphatidylserine/phosphatidylglycerophosphate/cardiolipin synthase-like enzyme